MNNDTGVYSITNRVNGKMYVGSAFSFKKRWYVHTRQLRSGIHPNRKLQAAWDKYGEEAFEFSKIVLCAIPDLISMEQAKMDQLQPEYNLAPRAGSQAGFKQSRDVVERLANARRGKYVGENSPNWGKRRSPETRALQSRLKIGKNLGKDHHNARAVVCIEERREFGSIAESLNWLREIGKSKASSTAISSACSGKGRSAYGFTWRFSDAPDKAPIGPNHLRGIGSHCSKPVICMETGERFYAMSDAARWLQSAGRPAASHWPIAQACKGKQKTAYGYHWSYA